MVRVACCGSLDVEGLSLEEAVRRCAAGQGFADASVVVYDNPLDLVEEIVYAKSGELVDLIVCGLGLSGMTGIELARDVRKHSGSVGIVLCAETSSDAYEALALRVDGYLTAPVERAAFDKALSRALARVGAYHAASIVVKCREGLRRIRFSQFLYAETVNHDQVVHLANGTTCSVRISSQAFFDRLQHDPRFFKVGSSYIVNVRKVRFVDSRSSTARLVDDSVIPVPVRVRRSLEKAILANE